MIFLHYILPLVLFYFLRDKLMLLGLLLGNLIDLDHVYYRIIGKVGWFSSACSSLGKECSIGFYPLHNPYLALLFCLGTLFLFSKKKPLRLCGWIFLGAFIHYLLDSLAFFSGVMI